MTLRAVLQRVAASAQDGLGRFTHKTPVDLGREFPLFQCNNSGPRDQLDAMSLDAINGVFPVLKTLACSHGDPSDPVELASSPRSPQQERVAQSLKERFDHHGSDKSTEHDCHLLYGALCPQPEEVRRVFEIGLGSPHADMLGNMGPQGRPGASLRAFRDVFAQAEIWGADIDRRILFQEERIRTVHADQCSAQSLAELAAGMPHDFDLVIDDGVHGPHANLEFLRFALVIARRGGWIVIEDIREEAAPLWAVVAAIIPSHKPRLYRCKQGLAFAVEKGEAGAGPAS
ncbi:hypothetical protein [Ramlibacter sp. PS4R-6]|uniref:hypothetical protein n=1 Tax=Ramlibacter sp. PS4R-6 TaxID=3133438 RepID=UPI0030B48467